MQVAQLRTYVGQTGRCLGKRMKEHRKAVESGDCANSALAEHTWSHHHPVDWDKVTVLEQQPHLYRRLTLESSHIRSHPHTLNRNNCILSPVPCFLVRYHFCTLTYCYTHPHLAPYFPCIVAYIRRVTLCFVPSLMKTTARLSKRLAIISLD